MSPPALELSDPAQQASFHSSRITGAFSNHHSLGYSRPSSAMAPLTEAQILAINEILVSAGTLAIYRRSLLQGVNASSNEHTALADDVAHKTLSLIAGHLRHNYPEDGIRAADTEVEHCGTSESWWVINALDGVRDFTEGFKQWSMSIARCGKDPASVFSWVYYPMHEEMLTCGGNTDPTLNGKPLAKIKDADHSHLSVALEDGSREAPHPFSRTGKRPNWTIRRDYTCATSALLAVVTNQVDGYYGTNEHMLNVSTILPIIKKLGGEAIITSGGADIPDRFKFACGNVDFIAYVRRETEAPMAADQ